MDKAAISAAVRAATAPGEPFETTVRRVNGIDYTTFVRGPEHLRDLYAEGLAYADRDFLVYEQERYTFQDSWNLAAKCANRLLGRGDPARGPRRHCAAQLPGMGIRLHGHHVHRRDRRGDERLVDRRRNDLRHRGQRPVGALRRPRAARTDRRPRETARRRPGHRPVPRRRLAHLGSLRRGTPRKRCPSWNSTATTTP